LGIAHFQWDLWDLTELAGVLGSQSLLEQLTIESQGWDRLLHLETIIEMLAVNKNLRCLELKCNITWCLNELPNKFAVDNALSAVFSRNEGSDHKANETLTRLVLPLDLVATATIATILHSNQTIRELVLLSPHGGPILTSPEDIVILLKAFEQNNTLRLLDLSGSSAVREQQDLYDAILNCLETKPWVHLNLQHTPLSESESRFTTIQQKLQQNAKFREAFGNWNTQLANSTGARVFLCGSPRAGKCRSHLPYVMSHIIFFEQILTSKGGY
jgi:hypothetical protein